MPSGASPLSLFRTLPVSLSRSEKAGYFKLEIRLNFSYRKTLAWVNVSQRERDQNKLNFTHSLGILAFAIVWKARRRNVDESLQATAMRTEALLIKFR